MSDQKMQPIYCQKCGHENPEGAVFCESCGTRLESPAPAFIRDTDYMEPEEEVYERTGPETYESTGEPESYESYSEPASYESYSAPSDAPAEEPVKEDSAPSFNKPSIDSEKLKESAEKLKDSAGKLAGAAGVLAGNARKKAKESYKKYNENRKNKPEPLAAGLNGMGTVNRTIRKYFEQGALLLWGFLIFVGIALIFTGFGIIIGIPLIIFSVYKMFTSGFAGEKEADQAAKEQIDRLRARGIEKISMECEDLDLIKPVVVAGFGSSPDDSLGLTERDFGVRRRFSLFKVKSSTDPEELYRIGSDELVRSMLLQVTVYAFSEEQMFLYFGNVDTSTGAIYNEGVCEIFYRDISSVGLSQELSKIFNRKTKRFNYYVREYIKILGSGFSYTTSMQSSLGSALTDQEFLAMKHLIRDKKQSLS